MTLAFARLLARIGLDESFRAEWERDRERAIEDEPELTEEDRTAARRVDVARAVREAEAALLARERVVRAAAPVTTRALGRFAQFQIREYSIEHPVALADDVAEAVRFVEHAGSLGDGAIRDVAAYERALLAPKSSRAVERFRHDVIAFARDASLVAPATRETWAYFALDGPRLVVERVEPVVGRAARALIMGRALEDAIEEARAAPADARAIAEWARERGLA